MKTIMLTLLSFCLFTISFGQTPQNTNDALQNELTSLKRKLNVVQSKYVLLNRNLKTVESQAENRDSLLFEATNSIKDLQKSISGTTNRLSVTQSDFTAFKDETNDAIASANHSILLFAYSIGALAILLLIVFVALYWFQKKMMQKMEERLTIFQNITNEKLDNALHENQEKINTFKENITHEITAFSTTLKNTESALRSMISNETKLTQETINEKVSNLNRIFEEKQSQFEKTLSKNASVNDIDYKVTYDRTSKKFTIKDNGAVVTDLRLLWNSGTNSGISAAGELGYSSAADDTGATSYESDNAVTLFTITAGTNDYIDFKEILSGSSAENTSELTARIPAGTYTDPDTLARAIEDALEDVSKEKGNRVDYEVSYSYISHRFTIKEDGDQGRKLEDFQLLWKTGTNAGKSAGSTLGFKDADAVSTPAMGKETSWGLFDTLFALKNYLEKDDVDGISRSMTRLDTHYKTITSTLSDIGIKYNRLDVRQKVSAETKLAIKDRKSTLEDADIIQSIMDLKSIQNAYQASLNSTAKVINISLVDFL